MQQENPSCILGGKMITYKIRGDSIKLEKHLEKMKKMQNRIDFDSFGKRGVEILSSATPRNTGKTAESWNYQVKYTKNGVSIYFNNSNLGSDGKTPVAIILQYGHTTRNGGWVKGINYIDPSIQQIFKDFASKCAEEVRVHG